MKPLCQRHACCGEENKKDCVFERGETGQRTGETEESDVGFDASRRRF